MVSNYNGVNQLLHSFLSNTTSLEVQKVDYVCVEYMEQVKFNQSSSGSNYCHHITSTVTRLTSNPTTEKLTTTITELDLFYTPFQATWEGFLYHHD